MAVKSDDFLSINAYAQRIGINEKSVRNAIRDGKIVKGYDTEKKKIKVKIADKEYGHLHKIAKPRPGVNKSKLVSKIESSDKSEKLVKKNTKSEVKSEQSEADKSVSGFDEIIGYEELLLQIPITPNLPYSEATRRREIIQLALEKKKLEEMENVLVRRVDVERVLFAFGSQLKKAILSAPSRVIDEILASNDKVEAINILTEELTNILTIYADPEKVKLVNK